MHALGLAVGKPAVLPLVHERKPEIALDDPRDHARWLSVLALPVVLVLVVAFIARPDTPHGWPGVPRTEVGGCTQPP